MRTTISILLILVIYSCANNINKEQIVLDEENVMMEYEMKSKSFTLEKLTTKKLQSYFELLKLKKEHPEFREGILTQLKNFADEEFDKAINSDNFSIENIRSVGEGMILSDSVQKMILYYDFRMENQTKTDSVLALIKTKTIILDGIPTKSRKITFSPIEKN